MTNQKKWENQRQNKSAETENGKKFNEETWGFLRNEKEFTHY